jgi:hypothetical protein
MAGLTIARCALLGTTVVGFRTAQSIVIGADSRENDGKDILPDPVCKILQPGKAKMFWVSAQLWKEPISGFSVEAIVNRAARQAVNVDQWVAAFDSRIGPELRRTIAVLKSEDPRTFHRYAGQHILEIVFLGFEHNVPIVFYRDYRTDAQGWLMEPDRLHCPGPKCRDPIEHFCLGECAHANAYRNARLMSSQPLAETVRDEILAEVKADWTVGPPIDVLRIDRTGARWIGRSPDSRCPPIRGH